MVTPAMRRYAAEIYRLQEDHPTVGLAELAAHVGASPQAVSRMITRLREGGYVVHEPYRGVHLTDEGERIAMPALRRHRLVEVFLVRVMGFGWHEVHSLTDRFETGIDRILEDRMDELAGHPTRCPHGEPIPSRDGVMPLVEDMSLVHAMQGKRYCLSRVRTHHPEKLRYLGEMKLVPGSQFLFDSCAPFRGPVRITIDQEQQVLGYDLAADLYVVLDTRSDYKPSQK